MNLQPISISKATKDILVAPIPSYLIQEREGGGKKKLSYISGSTVTDMLNSTFGYTWSWIAKKEWIQESIPFFNSYAKAGPGVEMTSHNGKAGAWTDQGPVAHVLGVLTVYMKDENGLTMAIEKTGYGSKSILGKQNDQESVFKSAGTDALKKAASLFGIGLELYRNEDEQAYFNEINYDNPWTDEMTIKYAKQLESLTKVIETYNLSDEEVADTVFDATNTVYEVLPENIDQVLAFISESISNSKNKEK